jgi:hypothetical protein
LERAKRGVARNRLTLHGIERSLEMRARWSGSTREAKSQSISFPKVR